jgi:hypothetical protein
MPRVELLPVTFDPDRLLMWADENFRRISDAVDKGTPDLSGNFPIANYTFPGNVTINSPFLNTGLELRNTTGDVFIDFTRTPGTADYNMRINNDTNGYLRVYGGTFEVVGPMIARQYTMAWGYGGALFNDRLCISTNGTPAFDAETLTLLGGVAGISLRSRNRPDSQATGRWVIYVIDDILRIYTEGSDRFRFLAGSTLNYGMYTTDRGISNSSAHDVQSYRAIGWGAQGISFWSTDGGLAPIVTSYYGNGDRIFVRTNPGTGYAPIAASAFEVNSTLREKQQVRTLEKGSLEKIKKMRPIRFKRDHNTKCANCKGKGSISPAEYLEHVHRQPRTTDTPANLLVPQPCPICSAYGTPGLINSPAVDRNEDTDYLFFAAEEIAEVVPEAAVYSPADPADAMSEPIPFGIDLAALVAVIAGAMQEIDARIDVLESAKKNE